MLSSAEILKKNSLKVTPQRIAIFDYLRNTDTHPTADMIYSALYVTHPYMSLATVYKTLDALKNVGLIDELNVGEGSFRYDGNVEPHHHIICNDCHKVYDLPPINSISAVEDELKSKAGFQVINTKLYLYGICHECSQIK